MAQGSTTGQPRTKLAPAARPPLSSEQVTDAFVHLARLAAAHAGWGARFTKPGDVVPEDPDEQSTAALAEATDILLRDRERMRAKMADVLVGKAKDMVAAIFKGAKSDDDLECVEDRVEEGLRNRLGLVLTKQEKNKFAIDRAYMKKHKGPVPAAAAAIGATFGLKTGRSIYDAQKDARKRPPIPSPLRRWVPLGDVRQFVVKVFEGVAERRRTAPLLPLGALRSKAHAEALMARVEGCFKGDALRGVDFARTEMAAILLAVRMEGQDPNYRPKLAPGGEELVLYIRALLATFREQVAAGAIVTGPASEPDLKGGPEPDQVHLQVVVPGGEAYTLVLGPGAQGVLAEVRQAVAAARQAELASTESWLPKRDQEDSRAWIQRLRGTSLDVSDHQLWLHPLWGVVVNPSVGAALRCGALVVLCATEGGHPRARELARTIADPAIVAVIEALVSRASDEELTQLVDEAMRG